MKNYLLIFFCILKSTFILTQCSQCNPGGYRLFANDTTLTSSVCYTSVEMLNNKLVTIPNGVTLTVCGDWQAYNGNGITVENGGTLIINGLLDINNNFALNSNGTVSIGSLNVNNNSDFTLEGTGSLSVSGDFTAGSGNDISISSGATISVGGDLTVSSGTITSSGTLSVSGTVSAGTSTITSNVYYIATNGSNLNSGITASSPKATLQNVFDTYNLNSGNIIYVAAGTYTEKNILVGTDDEGFTIEGASLDISGNPTSIFDSDQTNRWLRVTSDNNDNITFKNLKIKDYLEASRGGAGIDFTDGASSPTGYDVTGITITNCFFDNCDAASGENGGAIFYYNTAGVALSVTITSCSFYNSNGSVDGPTIYINKKLAVTI